MHFKVKLINLLACYMGTAQTGIKMRTFKIIPLDQYRMK